ncbi:unnamed protein product [Amoebophrya sp. A120]|nr:unnamed protein product [Amoebophrya sp. A120]|eukprot:GSA120T00001289001.1
MVDRLDLRHEAAENAARSGAIAWREDQEHRTSSFQHLLTGINEPCSNHPEGVSLYRESLYSNSRAELDRIKRKLLAEQQKETHFTFAKRRRDLVREVEMETKQSVRQESDVHLLARSVSSSGAGVAEALDTLNGQQQEPFVTPPAEQDSLQEKANLFLEFEHAFKKADLYWQQHLQELDSEHETRTAALRDRIQAVEQQIRKLQKEQQSSCSKTGAHHSGRTRSGSTSPGRSRGAASSPAASPHSELRYRQNQHGPTALRIRPASPGPPEEKKLRQEIAPGNMGGGQELLYHHGEDAEDKNDDDSEIVELKNQIRQKEQEVELLKLKRKLPQTRDLGVLRKMEETLSEKARNIEFTWAQVQEAVLNK